MNSYDGVLITLEGIDKAGKGTVFNRLKESLSAIFEEHDIDRDIVFTNEPNDDTTFGQTVRDSLESDETTHPLALFHGFLADHYQHIYETVLPALQRGDVVICDRYIDSRYVYQPPSIGEFVHDPYEWVKDVQTAPNYTPEPDMTIFLDISVDESLDRLGDVSGDTFEKHESLKHAREGYMELNNELDRFTRVDGEQSRNAVYNLCEFIITSHVDGEVHTDEESVANVLAFDVEQGDKVVIDFGSGDKRMMYVEHNEDDASVNGFGKHEFEMRDARGDVYSLTVTLEREYPGSIGANIDVENGNGSLVIDRLYA